MKKNLIRVLTALLTIVLILSMGTVAFAAPVAGKDTAPLSTPIDATDYSEIARNKARRANEVEQQGFGGLRKATPEQVARSENQMKTLTQEQISQLQAKGKLETAFRALAEAQGLSFAELAEEQGLPVDFFISKKTIPSTYSVASQNILRAPPSWISLSPFYYYAQGQSYSCLAAGVRMTLRWINGTAPTENVVMNACDISYWSGGGMLEDAVDYINNMQNAQDYLCVYTASLNTMKNHLYYTIAGVDLPALIGVYEDAAGTGIWPYDLASHNVTVYAIADNKTGVNVCDPYAGYMDEDDNRWYYVSAGDLHVAYEAAYSGYAW
ncbi:MAG: hypothetical protein LBT88_08245 [Oscillospiraceae bacterium]|nr:hypothetical protein [Oscillospiraceae bacterium]